MGWFRSTTSNADEAPRPLTLEERLAAIEPGVPGHCPACDGLGYIDDLDLGHRYQIQHCKDCGHRWEYLFDGPGHVVGLTELDELGQPVARMRVRRPDQLADRAVAAPAAPVVPPLPEPAAEPADDVVVDLRTPAPVVEVAGAHTVVDLRDPAPAEAEAMSPAEWLRHSLRR